MTRSVQFAPSKVYQHIHVHVHPGTVFLEELVCILQVEMDTYMYTQQGIIWS